MIAEETHRALRILVADDDSFVLASLLDFLEILGHKVFSAKNGREATQLFEEHSNSLDLVITDVRMPGIDGLELIRQIRKQDDALPIIVITGYADNNVLNDITGLDIPVFTKPISFTDLKKHLSNSVDGTASQH